VAVRHCLGLLHERGKLRNADIVRNELESNFGGGLQRIEGLFRRVYIGLEAGND
jgi:hypothetical protein